MSITELVTHTHKHTHTHTHTHTHVRVYVYVCVEVPYEIPHQPLPNFDISVNDLMRSLERVLQTVSVRTEGEWRCR